MEPSSRKYENSRIEIRISKEDKALYERASALRGFRSFSEFVRITIAKEAKTILAEEDQIISSIRDKKIFFEALMGKEERPNDALFSAVNDYKELQKK